MFPLLSAPLAPMPFFCLQRSRCRVLLSLPLGRNMVAGVILTMSDIQRISHDWEQNWNTAPGDRGFPLGWRTGHREFGPTLCAVSRNKRIHHHQWQREVRATLPKSWGPSPSHLPTHIPSPITVGRVILGTRRASLFLACIHKLFHFLFSVLNGSF